MRCSLLCVVSTFCVATTVLPPTVCAADYYGPGWRREARIALTWDENISRSARKDDIFEDWGTRISGIAGYRGTAGSNARFAVNGQVAYQHFADFDRLRNLEAAVDAYYTIQPSPGWFSPWFELSAHLARLEYPESDIRSGTIAGIRASAGRRLTAQATGYLGYAYSRRFADRAGVFDTAVHALDLDFDYALDQRALLYAGYSWQCGDMTSTATPVPGIEAAARKRVRDEVFSSGQGPAGQRYAYRLDGQTHLIGAGIELRVNRYTVLDLSGQWFHSDWGGPARYKGVSARTALLLQF
jgi:hypothetical protein